MTCLRWSHRADEAADFLARYDVAELPEETLLLRVAVLQEIERNGEAFATVSQYIASLGEDASISEPLMDTVIQAGLFSGQETALLPIYRRYLAAHPVGAMPWQTLLEEFDAGTIADTETYTRYAGTFAQLCEWNGLQEEGFEHHRRLAVLGHDPSVVRCLDLYLGLARQMDVDEILTRYQPSPKAPEHGVDASLLTRLHLKLMGGNGQYEQAAEGYHEWLAKNPDDMEAWSELALLFDEMGELEKSLSICERGLKHDPEHVGLRIHRARHLQSLGRYEDSLAILRNLKPGDHNVVTREDYELLSEALGSWEDFNKAVRLTIAAVEKPKVERFETLARSCEMMGDLEGELSALKKGLTVHPKSRSLAMNLASTLVDIGRYAEAVGILNLAGLERRACRGLSPDRYGRPA